MVYFSLREDFSFKHHMGTQFYYIVTSQQYLSTITGSDGVSFLLPHDFFSQHRLKKERTKDS